MRSETAGCGGHLLGGATKRASPHFPSQLRHTDDKLVTVNRSTRQQPEKGLPYEGIAFVCGELR